MGLFDFFGPKKTAEQLRNEAIELRDSGNREKALELLMKAIDKYNDAESMYVVGSIYSRKIKGDGLFNIKKAIQWWEKAVENGFTAARYPMALRLFHGEAGLKQDQKKAISLILKNHPSDFTIDEIKEYGLNYIPGILGAAYSDGIGVGQNLKKSRMYYEMGHQLGDSICTGGLSLAYYLGLNEFIQDQQKGVELALKAESTPCPYNSALKPTAAYIVLADAYSAGNFVDRDLNKAMKYCLELDKLGLPNAKAMIEAVKNMM